jgi:alpha-tubulin suppressor-like RCC1 family protein
MKPIANVRHIHDGFALPTVIIASVILLTVLVTAVTAVGSITAALASQYYNQLAREAAESGLTHARACLRSFNYSPTWTNAAPLKPNTDCYGVENGAVSKWIINGNNIRTAFTVPLPQTGSAGLVRVVSTGTVELTRASDSSQVWRTYTYIAAENSRYNDTPQIAGGAGWQENGHNGYMLAANGTLYGWGANNGQQLGDASLGTVVATPMKITLPDGVNRVKKVSNSGQGASILCILATHNTQGDQVYCRGVPGAGENGLMPLSPPGWYRFGLSAGLTALNVSENGVNGYAADSFCVIASDNQAYCAGIGSYGSFGTANGFAGVTSITNPLKFRLDLANPGPISGSAASLTVKKVFNQDAFTCVLASDDQAYCAGQNDYGQLGQGNTTMDAGLGKSTPGRSLLPAGSVVTDVKLTYHGAFEGVFYQLSNGNIYMSGFSGQGTANDPSAVNVYSTPRILTPGNYTKIISVGEQGGNFHSVCVIADSSFVPTNSGLMCMGQNRFGQLNLSSCTMRREWVTAIDLGTQRASALLNVQALYQMNSVAVITVGGDVYAAGDNTYGKLGRGGALQACNSGFARVLLPAGVKAVALANTDEYSMFILGDNGKVYAMGRNNNGQLGDGTTINRSTPIEVKIPRQETVY